MVAKALCCLFLVFVRFLDVVVKFVMCLVVKFVLLERTQAVIDSVQADRGHRRQTEFAR